MFESERVWQGTRVIVQLGEFKSASSKILSPPLRFPLVALVCRFFRRVSLLGCALSLTLSLSHSAFIFSSFTASNVAGNKCGGGLGVFLPLTKYGYVDLHLFDSVSVGRFKLELPLIGRFLHAFPSSSVCIYLLYKREKCYPLFSLLFFIFVDGLTSRSLSTTLKHQKILRI